MSTPSPYPQKHHAATRCEASCLLCEHFGHELQGLEDCTLIDFVHLSFCVFVHRFFVFFYTVAQSQQEPYMAL